MGENWPNLVTLRARRIRGFIAAKVTILIDRAFLALIFLTFFHLAMFSF
jgi:hypothetical protein